MIQLHGGNIFRYRDILDFSANINPLGTPESVKKAVLEGLTDIEKYPDPYCSELRNSLAAHEKTGYENIICGNGADDLIFRIVHAFKPKKALVCAPTFTEYRRALAEVGCEVREHILAEDGGFAMDECFLAQLDGGFDMCFVCTPNNPTGRLIAPEMTEKLALKCAENGTLLVCDECFLGFVEGAERFTLANFINEKCIILRAFTKLYAMAGIRLGYAVCGIPDTAEMIRKSGQFWSVSALAQTAGIAAIAEEEYVRKTRAFIAEERRFIAAEMSALGVKMFPSDANFLLFKSGAGLAEKMLAEGILIRDCSNFSGLTDGFYRVAVRTRDENIRLISALGRCVNV